MHITLYHYIIVYQVLLAFHNQRCPLLSLLLFLVRPPRTDDRQIQMIQGGTAITTTSHTLGLRMPSVRLYFVICAVGLEQ